MESKLEIKKIRQKSIDDLVALTPLQEGILFHYIQDYRSRAYFEQLSLEISGEIDIRYFGEAWNAVIETNEMMRNVFRWEKLEKPSQIILKEHPCQIRFHDLMDMDNYQGNAVLEEIKAKDRTEGFDLTLVPFRVILCKLDETKYEMIISNHHILYDGWSNGIILKEFFKAYHTLCKGEGLLKLPGKPPFKEFVRWLQSRDRTKQEQYWREYLTDFETPTELPIKRKTGETTGAEHYSIILEEDFKNKLDLFAKSNRVTLASVFYTAWGILLQRYCDSEDVIFGTTVSGRSADVKGIEDMVGLFINTVPLRFRSAPDTKLIDIITTAETALRQREEFENTPLVEIGSYSTVGGGGSLFDTIVGIENYPLDNGLMPEGCLLSVNSYSMKETTHYDLSVGIMLFNEIEIEFCFKPGLLEKETIENLAIHFKGIIQGVLEKPATAVSQLEIISSEEKKRILYEFNDTAIEYPSDKTIQQLFEEQASRVPDNIALNGNVSLTYRQLNGQSHRLAGLLIEKGVGPDTLVAILMESSVEMIIGILGILKSGGAYLPIDPVLPAERTKYMLLDSKAKVLLTNLPNAHRFNSHVSIVDYQSLMSSQKNPIHHPSSIRHHSNSLAYVIYTSGSTGRPKGVMVEHRPLLNLCCWHNRVFEVTPMDRATKYAGIGFDASAWEIFPYLAAGAAIYIMAEEIKLDMKEVNRYLEENKITIAFLPTPVCEQFMKQENRWLRILLTGGDTLREYVKRNYRLVNNYGPTENTVVSSSFTVEKQYRNIPIGRPVDNTQILILDGNGQLQPVTVPGELCVAGDSLARGYLNQPELTSEKFVSSSLLNVSLYRTGDLARWLPDGNIEFLGRIDNQVKIRGYRIELREIENQLLAHKEIKEAVVHSWENESGDKYICAYVVGEASSLKEYLSRTLPNYMIPAHFVKLESIPLSPNGKIDRNALPVPVIADTETYIPPQDRVQEKLVEIWRDVLGIENKKIGIETNFFEIGGHSLKATILTTMIKREFHVDLPLSEIFKTATIKALARYIQGRKPEKYAAVEAVEMKEYYPLSPGQTRFYLLQKMKPGSILYNVPFAIQMQEKADKEKLEAAFKELIARHESLRTSFEMVNETPVQIIHAEVDFNIEYYEITSEEDQQVLFNFAGAFDLSKPPLIRVTIVEGLSCPQTIIVDMHHIIIDGTSQVILQNEFLSLYFEPERQLPPVRVQYKEYSQWFNSRRGLKFIKSQESYWLNEFADEPPVLDLPIDFPRPLVQSFAGDRVNFSLDIEETQILKTIAAEHDATLYMSLLAVFNILFSKLSGQEDIIIGAPVAARRHIDLQPIVGMLVNSLALRNFPVPGKTFTAFFKEIKQRTLDAYDNQEYPFEELVDKISVHRDTSRNPLFEVMFALQNQVDEPGNDNDRGNDRRAINVRAVTHNLSRFALGFDAVEKRGEIEFHFEYCTKLFKLETIEKFIKYFKKIIAEIGTNRQRKIAAIDMIPRKEKEEILNMSNGLEENKHPPKPLSQMFEQVVEKYPLRIAVTDTGKEGISYAQLNREANQLAHLLRDKGVGPGSIVAVMIERSVKLITAILAILKAGAGYLPLDAQLPGLRIRRMLLDSQATLLITSSSVLDQFSFSHLKDLEASEKKLVRTATRPQIKNFEGLPLTDRTLVDYEKYHRYVGIARAKNTVSLQATRGCPYNCLYCHKIWPKTHMMRDADEIYREFRYCYDAGVRRFSFMDDIFNLREKNSGAFLRKIIQQRMDVQLYFPNGLRGDILTKDFIDLMIEAGTVEICLALETASPRLQKMLGKNLNLDKFQKNVHYLTNAHPHVILDMEIMIGFPTETEEEALRTFDMLKSFKWVHFPDLNILKIFPNTDMYRFAIANGVSQESIERSTTLAYHDLPETLPFPKTFARQYQARYMKEYFLSKERLLDVLPIQMATATQDELVQKYDGYLPLEVKSLDDILHFAAISKEELGDAELKPDGYLTAPGFNENIKKYFPVKKPDDDAFKILMLDLSLLFMKDSNVFYDMIEEPLGLMAVLSYLNKVFENKIEGKVAKSRIDFDSYEQLKAMIDQFKPKIIGIRTLTYYKEFFHKTVLLIRQWGFKGTIVSGGPYATSDYRLLLQDESVDLVVMGEGELTFAELVGEMMKNKNQLPPEDILSRIPGIVFPKGKKNQDHLTGQVNREIILPDQLKMSGELAKYPVKNLEHTMPTDNLLYVIYTSGSTGNPKGVMLEQQNFMNLIHFQYGHTNIDFSRVLQFTTIGFDVSAQEIFSTLLAGGQLFLIDKETLSDIPRLFETVKNHHIWTLFFPASYLNFVSSEEEYLKLMPSCVKHIVVAGEQPIINDKIKGFLQKNNVYFHNHYGPSESHVVTTLTLDPRGDIPARPAIGRPVSNTGIYILDKGMHLVPMGVAGELFITGTQVGRGYLNNPELTAEKFNRHLWDNHTSNVYNTGDLARWLPGGDIEFLGRRDHQVKVRGFRIELGEIEKQLLKRSEIKDAVVVAKTDINEEKYLCAYISPGVDSDVSELKHYLSASLPDYMIPAYFIPLKEIPLTPNGKVNRRALPELEISRGEGYVAPRGPVEEKLAEIWCGVLGKDSMQHAIGIDENFFQLGGHSLSATTMISRIHKELRVKVELVEIFKRSTIRELSEYINPLTEEKYHKLEPVEEREYYPLSAAQNRMYILQMMDVESTAYNMPQVMELEGDVDKERLEKAVTLLIKRHHAFRTSFEIQDNNPVQRIYSQVEFKIEYFVADQHGPTRAAGGENLLAFVQPFDLAQAPLLRVDLVRLAQKQHLLMVDMHHIISDGVSVEIMIKDFMALYNGEQLPEVGVTYKDYSQWQNRERAGKKILDQGEYWEKEFEGEIPVLQLPFDYTRPNSQLFEGNTVNFEISKETSDALKDLALESGTTLYILLLALYNILLAKISNREDIVVGTPVAGRRHTDLEKIIGIFVNTLALRNFPSGEKTFNLFLEDVGQRTLKALENQEYPYEDLVEKVAVIRDLSRNPLFDTMFSLQNSGSQKIEIPGLKLAPYPFDYKRAKFDLELSAVEAEENLSFILEYSTTLFKPGTIRRFIGYFKNLINRVVENKNCRISQLEILSEVELKQILVEFNDTQKEYPEDKTFHRLFAEQVEKSPDRIAVAGAASLQLTYRQLDERSNRMAYLLREKGTGRDDLVGILCQRSIEMLTAILAVWKAGGAYIPMDNELPLERLINILADAEVSILFTLSDSFPDIDKYYEKIATHTTVKHIVYLDKHENLDRCDNLFKTFGFASLLAKSIAIKPGKHQALHYKTQTFTYQEYMGRVSQLTQFILSRNLDAGSRVAVMISNPIYKIIALLSLNAAQIPFIIIDSYLPGDRRKKIIEEFEVQTVFAQDDLLDEVDRWLWESDILKNYIIFDAHNPGQSTRVADVKEIWNFVAEGSSEAINDYGWSDSYTNKPFSLEEMNQYIQNFKTKLSRFLSPRSRVLEIGCGHGLVLFEIAPEVSFYYATDLSEVIIEKNRKRLQREAFHNVKLETASASQIDMLDEKEFDLVICSSVIHYFPNSLYLEKVIIKAIDLLKDQGIIYLDDLMDLDKKDEWVRSTLEFKKLNPEARTKTGWDGDLFVKKEFFKDLQAKYPEITGCEISSKLGDIKNELTNLRYDAVLKIDKKIKAAPNGILKKNRYSWEDVDRYSGASAFSSAVVVSEDETDASKRTFAGDVSDVSDIRAIERYSTLAPENFNHPDDLSYVIYTSGTTGKPKGVMIEHRGMVNHIYAKINDLQLDDLSIVAQNASQMFDISVWQFFTALITGGRTVIFPDEIILEPKNFMNDILMSGITILEVVPSYLSVLLEIPVNEYPYSSLPLQLQYLLVTGEAVNPGLLKKWFLNYPGIKVVNAYGPTEASDDITHYTMDKAPETAQVPIGSPVQNMSIYIVDKYRAVCPLGIPGELCVSGVGIARGYLNRPEITAEKFVSDHLPGHPSPMTNLRFYKTGDLARWLNDGNIEFLGRLDSQVKIRGFRIELGEIETRLISYSGIKDATVLAQEEENAGKYLCAYIVADNQIEITALREYLSLELPDYMIPAYFVQLEKIPLTPNGKVDRKALPKPGEINLREDAAYALPSNEVEKKLVEIWGKVLGKENIGINENFFHVGGDSIKSIQIISRLNSAGYKLEIKDLFQYPVISGLAPRVTKLKRIPDQSAITGTIPLTPSQETFFNESHIDFHHYNQTRMLYSREGFDTGLIKKIFSHIQQHHDSLRMTYQREERQRDECQRDKSSGQIIQFNHGLEYPLYLEEHDLRKRENCLQELNTKANRLQESIDLEKGPLLKLGLFHLDDGDRLLIVIHRLVMDGLSWNILLEDIETLYRQYKRGEKLGLPPKTDSFKLWSEKLSAYANSKTFLKEKAYWQTIEAIETPLIQEDFTVDGNYIKDAGSVSFTLDQEETNLLHTRVNRAYKTEINDILLTALGLGIKKNFALDLVPIALEGDGREEIFEEIDISRTVGRFSPVYPVVMDISNTDNPGGQIKEIKETLRRIPNNGIGYGLLKHLTAEENKKDIQFKLKPQIRFNYMEQLHPDIKQKSFFEPAKESTGNWQSQNNRRGYLLHVSAMNANNRLTLTISFNKTHFKPETIAALARHFESELRYLIEFCINKETVQPTPADFTYKGLTIETIDRLTGEYPAIEDIYTLTPMQEGMLFHAIADDSSYSYFQHVYYRLLGELDIPLVEKSLNELFKRHDILRTTFVYDNIQRPVQLVLKDRTIDFYYEDIRNIGNGDEKENYIREFKTRDKKRLFDLSKDTLMRISIFRLVETVYEFTWSHHHILMDGWCAGILNSEFFEIYAGYLENRPSRLPAVKPYRHYLQWLEKRDADKSKNYWENYLENYEEPVVIPQLKIFKAHEKAYQNEFFIFELENGMTAGLEKLALRNYVTVNNIIQALWGIILGKYSGKRDVLFGAVVSGRPPEIEGIESMVGLFINTIPVRFRYEENTSFNELMRSAKEEFVKSEPHHYYPLAKIQANTHLKQNLLNHILGFQNLPMEEKIEGAPDSDNGSKEEKWKLTQVEFFEQTNYDFNVSILPGEELEINFNYNGNVYETDFVEIIAGHFKHLIRQVLNNEALLIHEMTLLTETEKKRILYDFNRQTFEYPADTCISRLFEQQVEKSPHRIAVTCKDERLTYKVLNEKASRLASVLRKKGVGPQRIVGLMLNRSIPMITGILAVLKAGGAYLPIHLNTAQDRILFMLADSCVSLLLTETGIFDTFSFSILQGLIEVKSSPYITTVRPPIQDLDQLPIPDRTLLDYEKYSLSLGQAMIKHTYITLFLTRGCPFNCAYCHKIWPKTHACRSAEHIFAEVKYFYDMGVRRFVIIDDIFNFNKTNSTKFFNMIIENGLDVQFFFTGGLRGDLLSKEYIDLLVKAGAVNIAVALETASPRVQKLIGKNLQLEKFRENIQYICETYPQVVLELFTMHGFPTETEEEAMMTLDFIKSLKWVHFPYVNILRIYANTSMERLAVEKGISPESIARSESLAYHELPETLPFDKSFTSKYQAQFLNEYFLSTERLLHVLPYQMKVFTEEEVVEKYDSFLPVDIGSFDDLLTFAGIEPGELGSHSRFLEPEKVQVPDFNRKLREHSPQRPNQPAPGALRVLLLDLSQYFSDEKKMLYDVFEPPMGLMCLMTYLEQQLGSNVNGKVVKSRVDFDSFNELKRLLEEFDPQIIGIRTLTLYKDFFHETAALIRQWGFDVPIITGGPYASGNYSTILQDVNIDLAVLGEGEQTFCQLIENVLENDGKLPPETQLKEIPGIAFVPRQPDALKRAAREILMIDQLGEGLSAEPGNYPRNINQSSDIAYVIYTSGSTGMPKGVMVEHRNVVSYIHAFHKAVPVSARDIVVQQASYAFDTFVEEVFSVLFRGGKIAVPEDHQLMDVHLLMDFLSKNSVTILDSSPLLLNELNKSAEIRRIPGLKFISGGDILRGEHISNLLKTGTIYNSYGPTETTVCVTFFECNGKNRFNVPIGKPMANNHVYILDEENRLSPIGVSGQLCVVGDGVSRGYLNHPELTAEKFSHPVLPHSLPHRSSPLYKTGDLARWLPDGNIEFRGRIDRQVKIRGFRIELQEIELALLRSDWVKEATVLAGQGKGEKYMCAYIVPSDEIDVTKTITGELREYLSLLLPYYMLPSYLVQLEKMPLTPNGKVDKKALPDPVLELTKETYVPPENDVEKKLSQVWQDVLGVGKIGTTGNFFEFGGDSIKAIQVSSRLKQYGLDLKVTDLFLTPTIKQLVNYVTETELVIPQETVSGEVVLTPIQQWFFQSALTDKHHFNQAVMLYGENGFDEDMLKKVFTKIVEHHDGLRMIYDSRQDIVIQVNRGLEGKLFDFEVYDFTGTAQTKIEIQERIEKEAGGIQGKIDLKAGPLVKIGLFKSRWGDHLAIVIHHLVVDGVSWRILLEDFSVGCRQWKKGEEISFQEKTHSFKYWAQRLKECAQGGETGENSVALGELDYWKAVDNVPVEPLPVDYEIDADLRKNKNISSLLLELEPAETELLLKKVNWAYGTEINDILLSALGLSLNEWAGMEKVAINLEGHGRESILAGVDIARTIGWFTTMFPVILDMSPEHNLSYVIKSVKETLRRIPNKGIGYGILKYLTPHDKKGGYAFALNPEICFNYLGQLDLETNKETAGKWMKLSHLGTGNTLSMESEPMHMIDINCILEDGRLKTIFAYNKYEYEANRIELLVQSYKSNLSAIIHHCSKMEEKEATPSDMGYAGISIDELEELEHDVNDII